MFLVAQGVLSETSKEMTSSVIHQLQLRVAVVSASPFLVTYVGVLGETKD